MFDFMDSDWFIIGLEIVFLILIAYDIKKYRETKKREYITNILLTIGFAIWTLYPYYNSYIGWEDEQKRVLLSTCEKESNVTLCSCIDDKIFKEYSYEEFIHVDRNSTDYKNFLTEAKEDCTDDSWF